MRVPLASGSWENVTASRDLRAVGTTLCEEREMQHVVHLGDRGSALRAMAGKFVISGAAKTACIARDAVYVWEAFERERQYG